MTERETGPLLAEGCPGELALTVMVEVPKGVFGPALTVKMMLSKLEGGTVA